MISEFYLRIVEHQNLESTPLLRQERFTKPYKAGTKWLKKNTQRIIKTINCELTKLLRNANNQFPRVFE